jgi:alkanesulfonate monooxygenase SsuD/methylene tetrahydromethanopterin reductase-like flavin-dependent oxidoreductase (luciferase family)
MLHHELRFSVLVVPNVPWPEFLNRCRHVEALCFDSLALADHLCDWTGGKGPWLELWTQLAAVAMATSRIRLATLVAQVPLRPPALLALQALTADHISGGRLELGLGTGLGTDPSHRMVGLDAWTPKERVARFAEYVALVSRLLTGEAVAHTGQYYAAETTGLAPRPLQSPRIPIIVAAMGPVMLRHAARLADIWNSISFAADFAAQLDETRGRIEAIDTACAAIGRDPATLRRSYLMFDPTARASGGRLAYYESEATFLAMAEKLIAAGISEIGLYYPALDTQRPVLERIARDVLPGLRERYKADAGQPG